MICMHCSLQRDQKLSTIYISRYITRVEFLL
jgi:hypothetical protein